MCSILTTLYLISTERVIYSTFSFTHPPWWGSRWTMHNYSEFTTLELQLHLFALTHPHCYWIFPRFVIILSFMVASPGSKVNRAPQPILESRIVFLEVRLAGSCLAPILWARVLELVLARVCQISKLVNVTQLLIPCEMLDSVWNFRSRYKPPPSPIEPVPTATAQGDV
jgi:hypothetical protein